MKKIVLTTLAVLMVISVAAYAYAAEEIWGRINSVDTSAQTMKIQNGRTGEFTLKFDGNSVITMNGKQIKLSEVPKYGNVKGQADKLQDNTYLAKSIQVTACQYNGLCGRVESTDKATLTVKMWNAQLGNFTVRLTSDAKITKDGKEIKFEDIKTGDMLRFDGTKQDDGTYLAKSATVNQRGGGCGGGGCRGGNGKGKGRGGK